MWGTYLVLVSHKDRVLIPFYIQKEEWVKKDVALDEPEVEQLAPELNTLLNEDLNEEVSAILDKKITALSVSELGKEIQYLEASQKFFSKQLSKIVLALFIEWIKVNSFDAEINDYELLCLDEESYEETIKDYKKNNYDVIFEYV